MIDYQAIINKFYTPHTDVWDTLVGHSEAVARLAVSIVDAHPELRADRDFVVEGAMLHDIGICRTNAPGIFCFGEAEYICHGMLGRQMLDELGLPRHALVCEHHTGAGISVDDIISQNLPLPQRDMLPTTVEEEIICYADKFFSKSKKLDEQKSFDKVLASLEKFGQPTVDRFLKLHKKYKFGQIV